MLLPSKLYTLLLFVVFSSSCAYYNTFYNAEQYFEEAEKLRLEKDGEMIPISAMDKYGKTIEKSKKVIEEFPESKYVNEARLLMGKARYYRSHYDLAIANLKLIMNDVLEIVGNLSLNSTSLAQFIIGFSLTIVLSLFLKIIYIKYSISVSNKSIIGDIFPLFAVSIFLIVITIKSSIVLSLGLVGALSIIRFRTAIKEAEQIVFFLILTGVSIATAANSYLFPILLVFFVFVYNFFIANKKENIIHSVNDQLVITVDKIENKKIDELALLLTKNNVNVEIQSINKNETNTVFVLKLSDFKLDTLTIVESFLKKNKLSRREIQYFSSSE